MLKEYHVEAYLGELQVSYRETIQEPITESYDYDKVIGGTRNRVKIVLQLKPSTIKEKPKIKVIVTKENDLGKIRADRLRSIESGILSALEHGPLLNFPVVGLDFNILEFESTYATTHAIISSAAASCVSAGLNNAKICLLEPLMRIHITTPVAYGSRIVSDLSSRRSHMGEISERTSGVRVVDALTPLSELVNYSTALRTISSGTATLSMEFETYSQMTDQEQKRAHERVTGFAA